MPNLVLNFGIDSDTGRSILRNSLSPRPLDEFGNPFIDPPWGDCREERTAFLGRLRQHLEQSMLQFIQQERALFQEPQGPQRNPVTGEFEGNQTIPESVVARPDLNEFYKRTQRKRLPTRYERNPVI